MAPFSTDTLQHSGRSFLVERFYDDSSGPPWEQSDGHGSARWIEDRDPLARGEVVLCDLPRGRWVYDFGSALLTAARDKWGLSPENRQRLADRLGRKPSRAQIRAESVRQDMAFLRGWCVDDWCYIGVCVRIIGPKGEPEGDRYDNALWGVESLGDYWEEVAQELADDILHDRRKVWRDALTEARKVKYWNARDVVTREGADK